MLQTGAPDDFDDGATMGRRWGDDGTTSVDMNACFCTCTVFVLGWVSHAAHAVRHNDWGDYRHDAATLSLCMPRRLMYAVHAANATYGSNGVRRRSLRCDAFWMEKQRVRNADAAAAWQRATLRTTVSSSFRFQVNLSANNGPPLPSL